ncbi:Prefoldin subunit-domain-containing protein [Rhodocollybia butyracea]|uniref:Prefoldin subunit-domain-containing protein n=1 Tax=Rhodocollybia butyracea TaxID=206335 RepID=A0A9P5UCX9_9AGAR|nr:Prefoldin subunit-domain-containing protein [Rhodocollybia butyracea]
MAQQQISLSDLDINQLGEIKKQFEEELNHLTNSFAQLKQAQAKFKACIENVAEIKPQNKNNTILVPLTNSLYVPGKLSDTEHVLVDVGTGYFVQKTRPQATKYYQAKVDYLQKNLETLEDTVQKKRDNMSAVVNVIQVKLQEQTKNAAKA